MTALRFLPVLLLLAPAAAAPVPMPKKADEPTSKSAANLLTHRKVQKELKLTADQRMGLVDGIEDINEAIEVKRNKLLRQPNLTPDVFDKIEEERQKQAEKFLSGAAAKLPTDTRKRLNQIDRQIRGLEAFTDADVQKVLALTDKQKKIVEKAVKDQEERIESYLNQVGNDNMDGAKEDLVHTRNERTKAVLDGLTADQKTLWTSLLGEPVKSFDLQEMWFLLLEAGESGPIP